MARRRGGPVPVVRLEYGFDRLLGRKLEQAYGILVPEHVRSTGAGLRVKEGSDEDGRDLRPGVVGQTEGRPHDSQPDGGSEGIRRGSRIRRA